MINNIAIKEWESAIDNRNLKLIKSVYCKDAVLMATFAKLEKIGIAEITPYFINLFKKPDLQVRFITYKTQKFGNVEVLSGQYIFSYKGLLNVVRSIPARYTFVTHTTSRGTKIVNLHSSLTP